MEKGRERERQRERERGVSTTSRLGLGVLHALKTPQNSHHTILRGAIQATGNKHTEIPQGF